MRCHDLKVVCSPAACCKQFEYCELKLIKGDGRRGDRNSQVNHNICYQCALVGSLRNCKRNCVSRTFQVMIRAGKSVYGTWKGVSVDESSVEKFCRYCL